MDSDATRLGRYGAIWCKDTVAYVAPTGTFFCSFMFTEATVFASLGFYNAATKTPSPGSVAATNTNCTVSSASTALISLTFPAGGQIYGMWTYFTLQSGGVIAYKVASKVANANG